MNKSKLDEKIKKIEQVVAAQSIIPPQKVFNYMSGETVEGEAERQEVTRLFYEWEQRTCELLREGLITINQLLDVIPEPWRSNFIDALVRQTDREKSLNKIERIGV